MEVPQPRVSTARVTPPFQVLRAATENTRMMHATLDELWARKRWVLWVMALALCLSTAWYWMNPTLYSSTVSFYVMAPPVQDKEAPIYLSVHTRPEALKLIATSSRMFDHLIGAFDLRTHFGVPAGSPHERTMLHGLLEERVVLDLRESEVVVVRVQDSDRALAAAMANAIFETTRSMVRADQRADLERQLRIYQNVIDSTDLVATSRAVELMRLADELRSARGGLGGASVSEQTLMSAANDVAALNQDLVRQRQNLANLLAMVAEQDGDKIQLRTGAFEDIGMHPILNAIQGILFITLVTGMVAAVLLMLIIENWFAPDPAQIRR